MNLKTKPIHIQKIVLLVSCILSVLLLSASKTVENESEITIHWANYTTIKLREIADERGIPLHFSGKVFSPVCEDAICYNVELIMHWNLAGEFISFDTIAGKPLTKNNHERFTHEDYVALAGILRNKQAVFSKLKKSELVSNNLDATSGATVSSVKSVSIPGAVYSCYTLWHIANTVANDSIRNITRGNIQKEVVERIINYQSVDADNFLLDVIAGNENHGYLPELLPLLLRNNWEYASRAFSILSDSAINTDVFGELITKHFASLDYFARIKLLKHLQSINYLLQPEMAYSLSNHLTENRYENDMILKLILQNSEKLSDDFFKTLLTTLLNQCHAISDDIKINLISKLSNRFEIRSEINKLKTK